MQTGYLILRIQNLQVVMFLHLVEQLYLGNPQSKRVLPDPQWNLQLVRHKMTCITVSLDIYVVDIIPLGNCSQMGLFLLII